MTSPHERVNAKNAKRDAMQERIRAAALPIFAERGFAATSIEQVARAAEMSIGAIYLYFKSKEDLYVSLLPELLSPLWLALEAAKRARDKRAVGSPWDVLMAWRHSHHVGPEILGVLSRPGVGAHLSPEVTTAINQALSEVKLSLGSDAAIWTAFLGAIGEDVLTINLGMPPVDRRDLMRAAG